MTEEYIKVAFSPISIMEFIRQVSVARYLNGQSLEQAVKFKISKDYYQQIMDFELKAQLIRLYLDYDEGQEVLSVKTDEVLLERFREQKSLVENAQKYEGQYAERYKQFIEVVD